MVTTERGGVGGVRKSNRQICPLPQPEAATALKEKKMIRSTLFTLLLLLPLQGQNPIDEIIEADRMIDEAIAIIDEAIADIKASVEIWEEIVTTLEELTEEELDLLYLLDSYNESAPEGENITAILLLEAMEEIEDGIDDFSPYARARTGEEFFDRVRTVIADFRRLMQLSGRDEEDEEDEADRIADEDVAAIKVSIEGLEETVKFLEELEELDLLDLFLESTPEGEKSTLVLILESMEEVKDDIDDLPPYARARMGEELIDRVRTLIADSRRLLQLSGRDE